MEEKIDILDTNVSIEKSKDSKIENLEVSKENSEILAKKNVEEMEKDAKELDLTKSESMLNDETDSIGHEPEIQEEVFKSDGVIEKLKSISERASKILDDAKSGIKKVLAGGMAVMAFSEAGNIREIKAEGMDNKQSTIESIEKNQKQRYVEEIEKIRNIAINEPNEYSFIFAKKSGEYIFPKGQEGNNFSNSFSVKEIRKYIGNEECSIELIHTHPAKLINPSDENIVEKIRKGEMENNLMPPSITDISNIIDKKNIFGDNFSKITSKVVEPSGIWEYSLNFENSQFDEIVNEFQDEFTTERVIKESNLTKEENSTLNKVSEYINFENMNSSVRFFMLIGLLEQTHIDICETISEKLASTILKKEEKLKEKYPEAYSDFKEIIDNERRITEFKSEGSKELIRKNMELYKKNGIILKHTPFEKIDKKTN